jgi:hypothetical protein
MTMALAQLPSSNHYFYLGPEKGQSRRRILLLTSTSAPSNPLVWLYVNTRGRVLPNHINPNILCGTLGKARRKKQRLLKSNP